MLKLSLVRVCGIHLRAIWRWVPKLLFCIMSQKIILLQLLPHLPGTNELRSSFRGTSQLQWPQGSLLLINLIFNMLNCFKDFKICIHILYHSLDFVKLKKTKFIMEQPYMLPSLYCQYHVCWCPGDFWSQGISRHGIDQRSWNIPSLASEELILAWISNHIPSKVWDEITYLFPNFNGCTIEVWERICNFIPHFIIGVITYLS